MAREADQNAALVDINHLTGEGLVALAIAIAAVDELVDERAAA